MKFYHDLRLKRDVLLINDAFEVFRNNCLNNHGLCPSHYVRVPGLSCDAMLEIIKVEIELIPGPDMHMFFEKGTRAGVSYISCRCSKLNKKYLKPYNPKEESKHIIHLDAKHKFLPESGFKWIDPKEFDLNKYASNSSKWCVLKIDLEHPKELQELYNDYPLASDKIEITREILSEYQLKIPDLNKIPLNNVLNLGPNVFDEGKYVPHCENLPLYWRIGLKLKTILRPLKFNQSQWLKLYIEFSP